MHSETRSSPFKMFNFQDTLAAKAVEEQQLGQYDFDVKDSTPLLGPATQSAKGLELSNRC